MGDEKEGITIAAANTDKWRKKRSNFSTTLNGSIASGDTTINLNSTSGLPTDTAVTLTIDRVNAGGTSTPTLMERVVGVVSGNQLINVTRGVDNSPGPTQAHSSGAVVEDIWDALSWNDAAASFLAEHNQAGTHNIPASSLISQYAVDGGSANAYSVTLSPAAASYATGMVVAFKAANANTTVSTLNVNALGVKTIKKLDGATDLAANDIKTGQIVYVRYDGTNFQMVSPSALSVTSASPTFTGTTTAPKIQGSASNANFPQVIGEFDNGNSGASITIDWSKGDRQKLTVSAATTLSYSNAVVGQTLILRVVENGTGGFSVTLPTSKWPGGSAGTFTTTANAINLLVVYYDGTNYLTQLSAGFS